MIDHDHVKDARAHGLGFRHVQIILVFLAVAMSYFLRINMSICIVEMTTANSTSGFPTYPWSAGERGVVLSSFFWGYVVTQVPAGLLAVRFGPKWFLLTGLVVTSALSAATPLLAAQGWQAVAASRVMQGLAQGVVYPSTHAMLSRWAPPAERARHTALVYSGIPVGTVVGMAGSGGLAASRLGWPAAFYVPGLVGLLWALAWAFLAANSPASSGRIGAPERDYIQAAFADTCSTEALAVPWRAMLTSVPMWALIAVHAAHNFGHWVLLTELPAYMKSVLGYDIASNGLTSALPYICLTASSLLVSWIGKVVNERGWLSQNVSRKLFQSAAHWGAGTMLLLLGLLRVDNASAVALLCAAVALEAGTLVGFLCNHMDMSPNFSGAMMGVSSCAGAAVAIVSPLLVSLITGDADQHSQQESSVRWRSVFLLSAAVYYVGNMIWVVFGSTAVQPWNSPTKSVSANCAGATDAVQ